MTKMKINSIFYSIQGESSYTGYPCVFIRLAGCNLNCSWCDTDHSCRSEMTIEKILEYVNLHDCPLVEITGGEPLIQSGVRTLAHQLGKDRKVLTETNGSINIQGMPGIRIVDVKCPSSGEHKKMEWANFELLSSEDEVKFVIQNVNDFRYAVGILHNIPSFIKVHFSPVSGVLEPDILAGWIRNHVPHVRLNCQLHKMIGIP